MIIDDKIFKASLLDTLADEPGFKRARYSANDAYSLATSRYYASEIDRANTALKLLRTTCAAHIKPALTRDERRRLLGNLGARLEFYAWTYHCGLQERNYDVLPDPSNDDIARLMRDGPPTLARHALTTITDQFIAFVREIVQRVEADWDDIHAAFFPSWQLSRLVKLGFTGSDSHKGGKSVVILAIQATRGNFPRREKRTLKLVYKPSDLTLDFLLVGDTVRMRNAVPGLPNPPGGSLLENINTLITARRHAPDDAFDRPHPGLAVYPILPRNGGNITGAYGYIKFLTSEPAPRVRPTSMRANKIKVPPPRRDWIAATPSELVDYYRAFGWLCAAGLTFGLADAHNGNLIVHRKRPYLIDNEIAFKWICNELGETGLTDVMGSWGPWSDDPNKVASDKCQLYFANTTSGRVEATKGARAAVCINAGLREAMALFRADPTTSLRTWLSSPALAQAVARYTPRATREYGSKLRTFYSNQRIVTAPQNPPQVAGDLAAAVKAWYSGDETYHRPNFALMHANHDWYDFMNCDYPVYYRVLGERELLNARGAVVRVSAPTLAHDHPTVAAPQTRTIAGPRYFDHFPAIHRFEVDVATLPPPAGTLVRLDTPTQLLADLTASFAAAVPPIALGDGAVATTETPGKHWRILDNNRIFHVLRRKETSVVEVFEAGSAIQMALRQFERIRDDPAYANALITAAQQCVGGLYPPPQPPQGAPTIFDAF